MTARRSAPQRTDATPSRVPARGVFFAPHLGDRQGGRVTELWQTTYRGGGEPAQMSWRN